MGYAEDHPGYRITTTEEAVAWLRQQLDELKQTRLSCDIALPGGPGETAAFQKRQYRKLVMRQFGALGALTALHRVGLFQDEAYARWRDEIMSVLVPTQVGDVSATAESGGDSR